MKKIIALFAAIAVALTFGVAFAQEQKMAEPEKKEEMKKEEMKKEEAAPMAPAGK